MTRPVDLPALSDSAPLQGSSASDLIRSMAEALPETRLLSRGYEGDAVTAFVSRVCSIVDELTRQFRDQKIDLEAAWAELTARRTGFLPDHSMSGPAADMIINQQRAAMQHGDDVVRIATEQGRLAVEAAQEQAAAVIAAAHAQASSIDNRAQARLVAVEQLASSMIDSMGEMHDRYRVELSRLTGRPEDVRLASNQGRLGHDSVRSGGSPHDVT